MSPLSDKMPLVNLRPAIDEQNLVAAELVQVKESTNKVERWMSVY